MFVFINKKKRKEKGMKTSLEKKQDKEKKYLKLTQKLLEISWVLPKLVKKFLFIHSSHKKVLTEKNRIDSNVLQLVFKIKKITKTIKKIVIVFVKKTKKKKEKKRNCAPFHSSPQPTLSAIKKNQSIKLKKCSRVENWKNVFEILVLIKKKQLFSSYFSLTQNIFFCFFQKEKIFHFC